MSRFDDKWLKEYIDRGGKVHGGTNPSDAPAEKRSKYGNQKTYSDGKKFDSRHEAVIYEQLRMQALAGEIKGFGCQFAFYLPGGVKYIADFVVIGADGTVRVMDAKSEATKKNAVYRMKKKQMKNCLGIEIEEV